MLSQFIVNGIVTGCLYAALALGFALVYNTTRIFHVAYGALYILGAYLAYLFLVRLHLPLVVSLGLTFVMTGLAGVVLERLVYVPLLKQKSSALILLLTSLGVYIATIPVAAMAFGPDPVQLRSDVETSFRLGGIILTRIQLIQAGSSLLALFLLFAVLRLTRLGRTIRALRDDPTLVALLGNDTPRLRSIIFALSSVMAGLIAILSALDIGIEPNAGLPALLTALVAMIIGGVGSFEGALAGGFSLSLLQSLIIWQSSPLWSDAVTFGVLILFLLFRPQGVLGTRKRLEEEGA